MQTWNMPEGYHVRQVTSDSLERDLVQEPLRVAPRITEGLEPYIASGERSFFIAETDRFEPVGRVAVNWTGSVSPVIRAFTGTMPNLAFMKVLEEHRGRGIGTAFIRGISGAADHGGYPGIFLTLRSSNEQARALYEREGFRVVTALGTIASKDDILQPDGTFTTIEVPSLVMTHEFSD